MYATYLEEKDERTKENPENLENPESLDDKFNYFSKYRF
jgi:hypothetical protein